MSILEDIQMALAELDIPVVTGAYKDKAPDAYIVVVPLADSWGYHADDLPRVDVQEARLALFSRASYTVMKNSVISALLAAGFSVTLRQYIGYEPDTGYFHYNIDTQKVYEMEGL